MLYEVRVKLHIEAESSEEATNLAVLFMKPSKQHMKEHDIKCWIRDPVVKECTCRPCRTQHGYQLTHKQGCPSMYYQ